MAKIQGRDVSANAPAAGQLLIWDDGGSSWLPSDLTFSQVNSALGAADASVSVNSQKITDVADPGDPGDAANKSYVDALAQGLSPKGVVTSGNHWAPADIPLGVNRYAYVVGEGENSAVVGPSSPLIIGAAYFDPNAIIPVSSIRGFY